MRHYKPAPTRGLNTPSITLGTPPLGGTLPNSLVSFPDDAEGIELLAAEPSGKCVGKAFLGESGSVVFLLPSFSVFDRDGCELGLKALYDALLAFEPETPPTPPPEWTSEVLGFGEEEQVKERDRLAESVADLQSQLKEQESSIEDTTKWKRLLYETGTPFERIADDAFELLGFKLLPTVPGRGDHRLGHSEQVAVAEVKGKEGGAQLRGARALRDWKEDEEGEENYGTVKGIFMINGFRLLPLDERGEVFTGNVIELANKEGFCCITGVQMYEIVQQVLADPSKKSHFRTELIETVGVLDLELTNPGIRN